MDYADDLGDLGAEAVERACRSWRQSDAKRFPTPGQLSKLAEPIAKAALRGPAPETWREITDAQYAALSLEDKIWHREKLADEASAKAASLWRRLPETKEGKPPSFVHFESSLPAEWARWRRVQVGHLAEAKRLRDSLKQSKERGAA